MTTSNDEHVDLDWQTEYGDNPWEITSNLLAFLPIVATAEANGLRWTLVIDLVVDHLACTNLDVKRLDDGPIITSELLRSFPIGRELYRIVKRNLTPTSRDPFATIERPAELLAGGPTDDTLRYVADVYQLAYACGLKPTKAVADLGIARSTAERWLRTAREKGLL